MKRILIISLLATFGMTGQAREYHVSVKGDDANTGTESAPFRTIGRAAQVAYPGDVITVHAGVYREWVNPPRGGDSDDNRIVYRAAPGERVEIKGSEIINNWQKEKNGLWKAVIPNTFFGDYNPYVDLIRGDWFADAVRNHHTGEVYLNNRSLYEKESLEKVLNSIANTDIADKEGATYTAIPPPTFPRLFPNDKEGSIYTSLVRVEEGFVVDFAHREGSIYTWYCETDEQNTTIWANFNRHNPNKELVEINVRRTCFYPEKQGVNYLTIQGFHISQAATQWAPPTAEQVGLIATHWNKGWIIENNVICNSKCSGITLGKERGTGQNVCLDDPDMHGATLYIEVIHRALKNGWSKENTGSHIVRNNEIFACEQTGICGSMGAAFCLIENNHIHDIWTKRQFFGAEIAGIKFHAAIDTRIHGNHIHRTGRGIWCDWEAQGTWISRNLLYDNDVEDLFLEVNHGPYMVENNILGSPRNILDISQGGTFAHNLFAGFCVRYGAPDRWIPYHLPHQTDIAGIANFLNGDNRFYNNLFLPVHLNEKSDYNAGAAYSYGLAVYNNVGYPSFAGSNAYYNQALPFEKEEHPLVLPDFNPGFKIENKGGEVYVSFSLKGLSGLQTEQVSTARLGKSRLAKQSYEQPDGKPIVIDRDYLGRPRSEHPSPGPFEQVKDGEMRWKVW